MNRYLSKEDMKRVNKQKKDVNIISHQENANQNHNEILLHTHQNAYSQKDR